MGKEMAQKKLSDQNLYLIKRIKTIFITWNIIKYLNYWTIQLYESLWQKNWTEFNDLSGNQYSVNKNIGFKTPMLRSDLCHYGDAYIAVKGAISVKGTDNANRKKTANLQN